MKVAMPRKQYFALDKEEQALWTSDPEGCFRHAVQRGAISLDEVTADLPPHMSAVVRSIVTGERLTASGIERTHSSDQYDPLYDPRCQWNQERALWALYNHPQLAQILDEQILSPAETMQAARILDHVMDRYTTGTRYAAP